MKQNREVTLYISTGKKKIQLDDFTGMSYDEARKQLLDLGFSSSRIKKKKNLVMRSLVEISSHNQKMKEQKSIPHQIRLLLLLVKEVSRR